MRTNLIIIDDFYGNPDLVRSFALNQPFNIRGNFPGKRTIPFLWGDVKKTLANILNPHAGEIKVWNDDSYSGSFQLTTSNDRTWIHSDHNVTWAGVCYLTPNAPLSGGTALYKHKKSESYSGLASDKDGYDYTSWEKVDQIGNKYNRLILYRGDLFHASVDYFGLLPENSRLIQTFFLNTEY